MMITGFTALMMVWISSSLPEQQISIRSPLPLPAAPFPALADKDYLEVV